MLQLICRIDFKQITPFGSTQRNKTLSINFTNEVTIKSSWEFMTDLCTIVIPRKLYYTNENGKLISFDDVNIYSNTSEPPLFMRGDEVKVYLGYIYPNVNNVGYQQDLNLEFDGYITKVDPKTPIELTCEDYFWKLKQIHAPNKSYSGNDYTVGSLIKEMIGNNLPSNYIIRDSAETKFGGVFITSNETIAQVLQRLKKEAYIFPYLRRISNKDGSYRYEIRVSSVIYYPEDLKDIKNNKEIDRNWKFEFQNNIISDDLVYNRKDDINIRIESKSYYEVNEGGKNKLKQITYTYPENFSSDSEKRQLIVYGKKTLSDLKAWAVQNSFRVIYDGFKGSITVFGLPSVRHGDLIRLIDNKFPERNGVYLCKRVDKKFSTSGFRQEIYLDMKVSDIDTVGNENKIAYIWNIYNNSGL